MQEQEENMVYTLCGTVIVRLAGDRQPAVLSNRVHYFTVVSILLLKQMI